LKFDFLFIYFEGGENIPSYTISFNENLNNALVKMAEKRRLTVTQLVRKLCEEAIKDEK